MSEEKRFESHHLSFEQLRGFITSALRENGWEVNADTLRIYGYGEEHTAELAGFQGHIDMRPAEAKPLPSVYMAVRRALADHEDERAQAIVRASNPTIYDELKHAIYGPTAIEPMIAIQMEREAVTGHVLPSDPLNCPRLGEVWESKKREIPGITKPKLPDVTVLGYDGSRVAFQVDGYEASDSLGLGAFQACYRLKTHQ